VGRLLLLLGLVSCSSNRFDVLAGIGMVIGLMVVCISLGLGRLVM
jgi:hypothetical protein